MKKWILFLFLFSPVPVLALTFSGGSGGSSSSSAITDGVTTTDLPTNAVPYESGGTITGSSSLTYDGSDVSVGGAVISSTEGFRATSAAQNASNPSLSLSGYSGDSTWNIATQDNSASGRLSYFMDTTEAFRFERNSGGAFKFSMLDPATSALIEVGDDTGDPQINGGGLYTFLGDGNTAYNWVSADNTGVQNGGLYSLRMNSTGVRVNATNSADTAKSVLDVNGAISCSTSTITSTTTLTAAYSNVGANATSTDFDVDLPSATSIGGREYFIYKSDAGANAVRIDPNGSQTINGNSLCTLADQYDGLWIVAINGGWIIKSNEGSVTCTP